MMRVIAKKGPHYCADKLTCKISPQKKSLDKNEVKAISTFAVW
jgi:hypothetical protein